MFLLLRFEQVVGRGKKSSRTIIHLNGLIKNSKAKKNCKKNYKLIRLKIREEKKKLKRFAPELKKNEKASVQNAK